MNDTNTSSSTRQDELVVGVDVDMNVDVGANLYPVSTSSLAEKEEEEEEEEETYATQQDEFVSPNLSIGQQYQPSQQQPQQSSQQHQQPFEYQYYAIIIDSGPIIKGNTHLESLLRKKAYKYVTVPAVMDEIRDSKSRHLLQSAGWMGLLHQDGTGTGTRAGTSSGSGLIVQHCSDYSLQRIIQFAKQTGDYASLSHVDLQVLALTLDMELEGCHLRHPVTMDGGTRTSTSTPLAMTTMSLSRHLLAHIRNTPKRMIGLGAIQPMNNKSKAAANSATTTSSSNSSDNITADNNGVVPENTAITTTNGGSNHCDNITKIQQADEENKVGNSNVNQNSEMTESMTTTMLSSLEYDVIEESDTDDDDDDNDDNDNRDDHYGDHGQNHDEELAQLVQQQQQKDRFQAASATNGGPKTWASLLVSNPNTISSSTAYTSDINIINEIVDHPAMYSNKMTAKTTTATITTSTSPAPLNDTLLVPPPSSLYPTILNGQLFGSMSLLTNDPTATTTTATTIQGRSRPPKSQFDNPGEFAWEDNDDVHGSDEDVELHQLEFPSLQVGVAAAVPNKREDDEHTMDEIAKKKQQHTNQDIVGGISVRPEEDKFKALLPMSKSGKLYNSFRKYKGLMKPSNPNATKWMNNDNEGNQSSRMSSSSSTSDSETNRMNNSKDNDNNDGVLVATKKPESKINGGGMVTTECMMTDEDDGEGWITSLKEIHVIKTQNGGVLDPKKGSFSTTTPTSMTGLTTTATTDIDTNTTPATATLPRSFTGHNSSSSRSCTSPPQSQRAACATTDFAMQNVLLQMNLLLLSVDGVHIRRLKSWVMRCGACFKIHSTDDDFYKGRMKRLFCAHCGSDMLQRVAASVDGKTGRLKLHFSKRLQGKHTSIRGTKFSLPKPGSGNRFQGDLLLREDQLLMGVWNQKVKIRTGGASRANTESMFGKDLAPNVGCCKPKSMNVVGDIRVGFGARKNPNASKGRERRGKKKKSTDRACGLRRY
jgi:rRNA maturation endonuclease Nob1